MKIKETDLYNPLKIYMENQGYKVNSEVKNCDIVAIKDEEIIIIELKTNFTVSLLIQAVKRKELTDSVYVAVPIPAGKKNLSNFSGILKVLRRLEIGLIIVNFMKTKTKINIALHPKEFKKIRKHKKRNAIITEINGRYSEFNKGGSPSKKEKINAYKQESIKIAYLLKKHGKSSPKELLKRGTGNKTQSILSNNFYGWFDRIERGIYELNKDGLKSLKKYEDILKVIINKNNLY